VKRNLKKEQIRFNGAIECGNRSWRETEWCRIKEIRALGKMAVIMHQ